MISTLQRAVYASSYHRLLSSKYIINESKKIPIEIINVVDLIKNKKPDLEDLIQLNKYFINIKKEENIDKNV